MPGLLCGSNLERARGILDDRSRGDICVVCCWGLLAVHVLLQGDNGGCVTLALVDGIVGPSVAFGIGVGAGLSLHFLRKRRKIGQHEYVCVLNKTSKILYIQNRSKKNVYVRNRRKEVRTYVAIKYVKIGSPKKSK